MTAEQACGRSLVTGSKHQGVSQQCAILHRQVACIVHEDRNKLVLDLLVSTTTAHLQPHLKDEAVLQQPLRSSSDPHPRRREQPTVLHRPERLDLLSSLSPGSCNPASSPWRSPSSQHHPWPSLFAKTCISTSISGCSRSEPYLSSAWHRRTACRTLQSSYKLASSTQTSPHSSTSWTAELTNNHHTCQHLSRVLPPTASTSKPQTRCSAAHIL
eukprot:768479-Hanusia_phi.AAC.7